MAAPRIGMAVAVTLVVGGQVIMALAIDHFGWAGMLQKSITLSKLGGVALVIAGIWLIKK